jgi:hypothetical protein
VENGRGHPRWGGLLILTERLTSSLQTSLQPILYGFLYSLHSPKSLPLLVLRNGRYWT